MRPHTVARIAAVLAIVVAAWLPAGPFYLTNDDVAMRLLSEGRFAPGAAPSPFLMFINVAVGWPMAVLYSRGSIVPWYDVLMLTTSLAASAALIFVWTEPWTRLAYLRALLLGAFFLAPIFATPHFSLVGMTCAAAGLALLARALTASVPLVSRRRYLAWGTALFSWGALVRWEGAALMLCQAAFAGIAFAFVRNERGPRLMAALRITGILVAVLALIFLVQTTAYRATPGWRDFPGFNLDRGRIAEYGAGRVASPAQLSELEARTGWSANDLELLRNWFFLDPSVFTSDRLRVATAILDERIGDDGARVRAAGNAVMSLIAQTWPALLIVVAMSAASAPMNRFAIATMLILQFLLAFFVVTVVLKEVPFRVYWPMLVLIVGLMSAPATSSSGRWWAALPLLIIIATVTVGAVERYREQMLREANARVVSMDVAALGRDGLSFAVIHADALEWESFVRPFHRFDLGLPFVAIGASAQTPPVQNALQQVGNGDIVQSMCRNPAIVLIARPFLLPMLTTMMLERHGQAVRFEPALAGHTFTAWRCVAE